jgi:TniQ
MKPTAPTPAMKILPFFPSALPDETISSRVSRYHIRRGQLGNNSTYTELFGRTAFSLTPLVQPYLDKLALRLPGSAVANLRELQDDSTLLPLFRRFFGTHLAKRQTVGSEITAIELPRRLVGGSRLTHLCAECLVDDSKEHGCRYIHRSHQIPGVTVCWRHATPLMDRCPACRQPFSQPGQLILSAWIGCDCGHDPAALKREDTVSTETELAFALFSKALIDAPPTHLTPKQLVQIYRFRGIEIGFKYGSQYLKRKALFTSIEAFFTTPILARMDPAFGKGKTSGWFHVLQPSTTMEAPLYRHLMFAFYLFRDANLFLARIEELLNKDRNNSAGDSVETPWIDNREEKTAGDELLEDLIYSAIRLGYDPQQLWHHNVGKMKRLVKLMPDAYERIEARLKHETTKTQQRVTRRLSTKARDDGLDQEWATAIASSSASIYQKEQLPFRVTMNQVVKHTTGSPKGMLFPTATRTPLARAAADAHAESIWHFYARRMLWTLQSLNDPETPAHAIIKLARLEVNKAREILKYFSNVRRCGGPSIKEINQVLAARNIGRDWAGPCPDKTFYKTGRGYRLRTARRGPIGGRAGDWE